MRLALDNLKAELTPPSILVNDTDANGDPLTAVLVTGPAHGSLSLNANGTFTYTPHANFNGTDSFTYRVSDGKSLSDPATVTIAVIPVNDAPVANDDEVTTDEDTAVSGNVLGNDTDVDGNSLSAASVVTGPQHGGLVLNPSGSFIYHRPRLLRVRQLHLQDQ